MKNIFIISLVLASSLAHSTPTITPSFSEENEFAIGEEVLVRHDVFYSPDEILLDDMLLAMHRGARRTGDDWVLATVIRSPHPNVYVIAANAKLPSRLPWSHFMELPPQNRPTSFGPSLERTVTLWAEEIGKLPRH